jgi:hypothetical protein
MRRNKSAGHRAAFMAALKKNGRKRMRRNVSAGTVRKAKGTDEAKALRAKIKAEKKAAKAKQKLLSRQTRVAKVAAAKEKQKATSAKTEAKKAEKAKKKAEKKAKEYKAKYRTVKTAGKRRVAYQFGPYRRMWAADPERGGKRPSYLYKTRKGKVRHIPLDAVIGHAKGTPEYAKALAKYMKVRKAAAERLTKHGGPFVANKAGRKGKKGKKARKSRKASKGKWNLKRFNKARADGMSVADAKKVGFGTKKAGKSRKAKKGGKRKSRKGGKRKARKSRKGGKRKARKSRKGGKRKARKSRKGGKRKARKSRKGGKRKARKSRKGGKRKARKSRKGGKRKARKSRKGRKSPSIRSLKRGKIYYAPNRRRSRRRKMRRNQLGAMFKAVMKKGALVALGFLVHRVLTSLAVTKLLPLLKSPAPAAPAGFDLATFERPLAGIPVAAIGILVAHYTAKGAKQEIAAGMVASLAQSVVVSVLRAANVTSVAGHLEGYSSSQAYALRGMRGMRGFRGLGAAPRSILPGYAPVGQFRQAAAGLGTYRQAAAGTGEYFQPNAMGEYFVPNSVRGVGSYEPAGPLALQASAGTGQFIDDGIKPDSNLDAVMDLAESAAGLRGPLGEYYTAQNQGGAWNEAVVPTQDQWVPNGPMWAGTMGGNDTAADSELPAGILAGAGGNGSLSA